MRKVVRALCYLKELCLMAFLSCSVRSAGAAVPNIGSCGWYERGNDARDNGYWFYRYLKEEHPEINARYVIETESADRAKIEALGGMVPRGSFSHYLAYYCADFLVGTHVQPCAPDLILFYHLAGKGIRARGKQVFLQHGIIKDEMEWLHRKNMYMDLFVCGAKPEYEYIRDTFGYPEHVPQYVGLARFDNLIRAERKEKMILVMPTWRGSYYPTGEAFRNTAYYEHFQSLLCCKELDQLLEQQDYRLVFYPHVEMQKDSRMFESGSDRITIVSKETHDVQSF
ncbi:MAG: CDP-glycerol glycerophosphotransferase family protein [Gallintestinimicrobium sp.]